MLAAELEIRLPSIGLALNKTKTVVACSDPLAKFPRLQQDKRVDLTSSSEGVRVLEVSLGGADFVRAELGLLLGKVAKFCQRTTELDHPQAATLLLSKCCGVCRVAHTLMVLHPSVVRTFVPEFDQLMLDTVEKISGFSLDELRRSQAALPVRLGGLGLQSAALLSPVAFFVAPWAFQVRGKDAIAFTDTWDDEWASPHKDLAEVCKLLPGTSVLPRVWLAEDSLPETVKEEWLHQKWWVTQVEKLQQEQLLSKASGRDVVRLQCLSRNASGAWLHAIPSRALGLEFSPAVFRTLLKFWLGIPFVEETTDGPAVCPFCDGPSDIFGDHVLCCKKAEFYSRHQAVVEFLSQYIRAAGIKVENDVQIGGRQRPADLLITRWTGLLPLAGDVVVTHPLAPSLGLSSAAAAAAVRNKVTRKKAKYAELVAVHNLEFAPLAFSTFGGLGEDCLSSRPVTALVVLLACDNRIGTFLGTKCPHLCHSPPFPVVFESGVWWTRPGSCLLSALLPGIRLFQLSTPSP